MASPHHRNTLPEGDRPAEQLEGSLEDAIQEQAADTPQSMQLVLFKKPILDVSTVVTRNTLEDFAVLIPGLEQISSDRPNEIEGTYPEQDGMTWAGLFTDSLTHRRDPVIDLLSFTWDLHQAGLPTYIVTRAWNGRDRILRTKDIEEATICVLAKVAPLIRKLEIAKLEEVD